MKEVRRRLRKARPDGLHGLHDDADVGAVEALATGKC
jgi:hypothetical protein